MNDQQERGQALNISESFIVQAPAGSGKTELITQRYLKLLGCADQPENVLVMTFTNKAVDELKHRIINALNQVKMTAPKEQHKLTTFQLAKQVMEQSRKNKWDLLNHPSRIKIVTFDSLSSLIVSRYPSLDQLIPPRTMTDSYESEEIYKKVAENTIKNIDDKDYTKCISSVFLYLDNNVERFCKLIVHMLKKREQWLTKLYRQGVLDTKSLEQTAQEIIIDHLKVLRKTANEILSPKFFNLLRTNKRDDINKILKLPNCNLEDLSQWQSIAELLLTKDGNWRKNVDKKIGFPPELKEEKEYLKIILEELGSASSFKKILNDLTNLPSAFIEKSTNVHINDIAKVLKLSVAELNIIFKEQNVQDYAEVLMQAIAALNSREEVSDIALMLDYQIKHLLIDEFQDTSYSQFNLIEKLVENWNLDDAKTIFLVGDPMQSIYKFRESQVGIFLQVIKNSIGNLKINSLTLTSNFRSNKSIVDINNSIFSQVFPKENQTLFDAIKFSKSSSVSQKDSINAVNFYPFNIGQDVRESEKVIDIINDSLRDDSEQEIAILVRSRSHLKEIIRSLQFHRINFEAIKTEPLIENLFTKDLISLARALLSLSDKLAWLALLRSPWCGLLLKDLLIISESKEITIFHQLQSNQLSADGIKRSQHLYHAIEEVILSEGKFSFVERFSYALSKLSADNELSEQQRIIKAQFLNVLNSCEVNQTLNFKAIQLMLQDKYAPSQLAQVKLMTIHEAKGLEFDTVILPGLGKSGKSDSLALIQFQEIANNNILLAPIKSASEKNESQTYLYLQYLKKQQSHFELMRLLYVAMTRAKEKLYLLGSIKKTGKVNSNSMLAFLSHYYEKKIEDLESESEVIIKESKAPKLSRYKKLTLISKRNISENQSKNNTNNIELIYRSALGSIVHYYLEHNEFDPSIRSIEIKFEEYGLPKKLIKSYCKEVHDLLQNTSSDEDFDWLFKKRVSTEVEAEYSSFNKTVIIDRLFIEDDVLWIIDFKTASLGKGESISSFIERQKKSHLKQIMEYQEILEDIFKLPSRLAIYCPAISQLIIL